jgi:4-hydroxythreonine-4-phosphate dehydrogenase
MKSSLEIVITPGDPEGIGPEVTRKALRSLKSELRNHPVTLVGKASLFPGLSRIRFIEPPGRASPGYQSGWAVETATRYVMESPLTRALVTGPISKERLKKAGFPYQGHTDFLASLTSTRGVTMMLANDTFRVCLVTNHCALSEVPGKITPAAIESAFLHARQFCQDLLGKKNPKIAILGLNPHSGESGLLGSEEQTVIRPTLKRLSNRHKECSITGPHPADSFFAVEAGKKSKDRNDVILAMYHDQGLIPLKLSGFSESMNMTLGLPIIRTSVDHGTAFDLAGKNQADAGSMIYAIRKAIQYLERRRKE